MKKLLLAASLAAATVCASAPASAMVKFSFTPGGASPTAGYTLVNTFADATGITGSNFLIKTPPGDGQGAPPANSFPAGTSYLSVLGGGTATISLGGDVHRFQFDWGSVDSYNLLTINSSGADPVVVPGLSFPNAANGNQVDPGTNGVFTVWGTAGETFNSITLTSGSNSFEIDNLAVASVPEPATWGLMIMGFGGLGAVLRRRRGAVATFA
jgi:hypothetical protein